MTEIKKSMQIPTNHSLSIDGRNRTSMSGVIDVEGFSEDKVDIQTTMGKIVVRGKQLNVKSLDTDTGELKMTGEIRSLEYSHTKKNGGLLSGLFK